MAEEKKKEKRSDKRYNHGPRIVNKLPDKGEPVTETKPEKEAGGKPHAEELAGTDHIPVPEKSTEQPKAEEHAAMEGSGEIHIRHGKEMKDMHTRHARETEDMHERHRDEHRKMAARHVKEHGGEEEKK